MFNMAKIAAISLTRLSLKNFSRRRLIAITNFVIFLAFFAISAAIISLFFEKRIEELNKKLSNELGNEIIYSYWLSETPKNIRNIESLLSQISREHSYLVYMQSLNDILITDRDTAKDPIQALLSFNRTGLKYLRESLKDAVMVSSSQDDIEEIIRTKEKIQKISTSFSIVEKYTLNAIEWEYRFKRLSDENKKALYERALTAKPDLINSLNEIINLNINFNLNYYFKKKNESQNKISKIKEEIKIISNNESRSILFAFIVQLIIFLIIQFFEFGFELTQKIRKSKK